MKIINSAIIAFLAFNGFAHAKEPTGLLTCNQPSCAQSLYVYCAIRSERDGLWGLPERELDTESRNVIAACNKAAELGSPDAQYAIGGIRLVEALRKSTPRENELTSAAALLLSAAEHGHSGAQREVGIMYLNGQVFAKSKVEAYKWLQLYALQSLSETEPKELTALKESMTESEIKQAEDKVESWRPN